MNKVLYISNIEVPYRTAFFNQLSEKCDLTVLYERRRSKNRDNNWAGSIQAVVKKEFLGGMNVSNEYAFSLRIVKWLLMDFDCFIIGCYNSPVQILAVFLLRLFGKKVIISNDGEYVFPKGLKSKFKRMIFSNADIIITAGNKSADMFRELFPHKQVFSYFFSSLDRNEIEQNSQTECERSDYYIVIGQYFPYKGLDIALSMASRYPEIKFKFIGTGNRTGLFTDEQKTSLFSNVEVIPFMGKKELADEYTHCRGIILPSRKECWGLVINEAASFGTPIISTSGSGAAVEFLSDDYPMFLAEYGSVNDAGSLADAFERFINYGNKAGYSEFLIRKSKEYCIERMVSAHLDAIKALCNESSCRK